jgi:hypothetical protein
LALLIVFFGVILPILAIFVELNFRICATSCFDPFPSNLHVMLFSLIPLGNALVLLSMRRDLSDHYAFLCLLNGMSAGIGLTYSLMFLPLLPVSVLLILAFGFGLLGLTPLTSLLSTIGAGWIICHQAKTHDTYFDPEHSKHLGHLLVIASIIAIELPSTLTRVHLNMASEPANAAEGLMWLRQHGNEEVMLRACYERSGRATDVLGSLYECGHPMNVETARRIFYQVTGKPFNSVPIPMGARATMQHAQVAINGALIQDEFDVDTGIAGESVSSVARGLTLDKSQISGEFIPGTADAALTWTLELNNASAYDREARTVVKVPPNAVVNKVSLVIDGKKLESHIQVREVARATYRSGIFTGRDPLLVSWCGPDTVLVQCYPIHKQSVATITIGMIVPLSLESNNRGTLWMPFLQEQNFAVKAAPCLEIRSPSKLVTNADDLSATSSKGVYCITGDLAKSKIRCDQVKFTVPIALAARPSQCLSAASAQLPTEPRETIIRKLPNKLTKICVLIDGSVNVAKYKEDIMNGMSKVKPAANNRLGTDFILKIVSDVEILKAQNELSRGILSAPSDPRAALANRALSGVIPLFVQSPQAPIQNGLDVQLRSLRDFSFVGGQDNRAALEAALVDHARYPNSAIVWIHGAQPLSQSGARIREILDAKYDSPLLYDLQLEPGANQILAGTVCSTSLERVPTSGNLQEDIVQLFSRLLDRKDYYYVVRQGQLGADTKAAISQSDTRATVDQSDPVKVLLARDLVLAQRRRDSLTQNHDVNELALKFNIVTPISSAIVHDPNPSVKLDTPPPAALPPHRFRRLGALLSRFAGLEQVNGVRQQYPSVPATPAPARSAPTASTNSPTFQQTAIQPHSLVELKRVELKKDKASQSLLDEEPIVLAKVKTDDHKHVRIDSVTAEEKQVAAKPAGGAVGGGVDAFSTGARQGSIGYGAQNASAPQESAEDSLQQEQKEDNWRFTKKSSSLSSFANSASQTAQGDLKEPLAPAPSLSGASNGTIGPQGQDATYIEGKNTAGRVESFPPVSADLEADAKPAPEPGFWLLFVISGLMLLLSFFFLLRRRSSSPN